MPDDTVDYVVILEGEDGWYWRAMSNNGKKVAIGGEPFTSRQNAVDGAAGVVSGDYPYFDDDSAELHDYLRKVHGNG